MNMRVEGSKRYAVCIAVVVLGFTAAVLKHFLPGLSNEIVIATLTFAGSYVGFESWKTTTNKPKPPETGGAE